MSISNIGQTQGTRTSQNNGIDNRDLHIGLIHNPLINEFNLWLKGSAYVLQYHVRIANHLGNVVPFNYIMDKKNKNPHQYEIVTRNTYTKKQICLKYFILKCLNMSISAKHSRQGRQTKCKQPKTKEKYEKK
jgi:hypothetical protein